MLGNPFDESLTPEAKKQVAALKSFHMAQAEGADLVRTCWINRQKHRAEWEAAKQAHHTRRTEEAEAKEDAEGCYVPAAERSVREEVDDRRFATVTHEDELLELRNHEDYLAGKRALHRRTKKTNLFITTEVAAEDPPTWTGSRVWAGVVGLFFGYLFVFMLAKAGLSAILAAPFLYIGWIGVVRLGQIYGGDGGGWGSSRGTSGNAI